MPRTHRYYVTVAGAFQVYSGIKLNEVVDAVWSHLVGYGRVYVKQTDDMGRMRRVAIVLKPNEQLVFTPESMRDELWVEIVRAAVLRGPTPSGEARAG